MSTNFDFLKTFDKNLYNIINEAENLYRDEYFDQCMTQTRKFGENICKKVLGSRRTTEITFDSMLATLKDCSIGGTEEAKEFIDDLYFLKKHGNEATHSFRIKTDGIEALECLQRAFEAAINYCVYSCGSSKNILKLKYDTELLITGKETKKSLAEKYEEQKLKTTNKSERKNKSAPKKKTKQYCSVKSTGNRNTFPYFWLFVGISAIISAVMLIMIAL